MWYRMYSYCARIDELKPRENFNLYSSAIWSVGVFDCDQMFFSSFPVYNIAIQRIALFTAVDSKLKQTNEVVPQEEYLNSINIVYSFSNFDNLQLNSSSN